MPVPKSAVDFYNRVDKLGARANKAGQDAWQQVDSKNIRESWRYISGLLAISLATAQEEAAWLGASYGAQTLAAQGL